jgi:hypothetical protein
MTKLVLKEALVSSVTWYFKFKKLADSHKHAGLPAFLKNAYLTLIIVVLGVPYDIWKISYNLS